MAQIIYNAKLLAHYSQLKSLEIEKGVNMDIELIQKYNCIIADCLNNKYEP